MTDPGIEPRSPALQADPIPSEPPGKPHSDHVKTRFHLNSIKCYGRKQVSYMCRSSFNTMTITDF